MDVVSGAKHPHHSPAPARCTKSHCRCGVSDNGGLVRLETEPDPVQENCQSLSPIEVDLFASRLTAQCPVYFSWRPDSYAAATDAFLQDWSQIQGYANPPWSLIRRVLSQVQVQPYIILVAPVWKTQSWYPLLLGMLRAYPYLIRHHQIMLNQDSESLSPPQLAVWPISQGEIQRA